MKRFVISVKSSIEANNWFAALFMCLALPDICGALETPERGVGDRYKDWFNRYLKKKYDPDTLYESIANTSPEILESMSQDIIEGWKAQPINKEISFTAEDCYRLRCKCLHQGLSKKMGNNKVHFTIPDLIGENKVHQNSFNGVLQLSIDQFCIDVCNAVDMWSEDVKTDTDIQSRVSELIKIYGLDSEELPILHYR